MAHTGRHRLLSLQRQGACPRPEGSQTLGQPSCGGEQSGRGVSESGCWGHWASSHLLVQQFPGRRTATQLSGEGARLPPWC